MGRFFVTVGTLGLGVLVAGCGGTYKGDQRFPLTGTATFNGEPIDLGSISLIPAGGAAAGGASNSRASGGIIKDGKYIITEENGPNTGTYRVEIHWLKKTGKELVDKEAGYTYDERIEALPEKFHKNSELTVEIPAPDDTHDLDLKAS